MNEQRIREIVAEIGGYREDAIVYAISDELGQDVGDVLDGVIEETHEQLPERSREYLKDHRGEDLYEAISELQKDDRYDFEVALTKVILNRLQRAGFLKVPREA